jgi:tRNA(adenine34) deaminase
VTPDPSDAAAWMRIAIQASRDAMAAGDMPYGAVLASAASPQPLVAGNNQITTGDCTGHAELVLVRNATRRLGAAALRGATVYASGEPCAMCCGAMFFAGIARVVYSVPMQRMAQIVGGPTLAVDSRGVLAGADPVLAVDGPLLEDEGAAVLQAYADAARQGTDPRFG